MKCHSLLALALSSTLCTLAAIAPSYSLPTDELTEERERVEIAQHAISQHAIAQPPIAKPPIAQSPTSEPVLLQQLPSLEQPITSVAISPLGNFVVSGSENSTLQLWDLRSRRIMRTLPGHTEEVTSLTFSPNGRMLVSASTDNTIKIWNLAMSRLKLTIYTDRDIHSVAMSPHGQTFASGNAEGVVEIWNLNTGKKRREFATPISSEVKVSYSPDGTLLATRYRDRSVVHFWNPLTGELLGTTYDSVPLSDGENSARGECEAWWHQNSTHCGAIAQTPDGQILADIDRQQILLWHLPDTTEFTASAPR
ncbi:WD40 repeat domain-containing protein [Roseofilum casamattae]|uniref:WD40 repeat domain-containing protein n=1 Tax=Roseofilum casamattae BLCC-M143 TaxID=3022442 RepID=A0ABT7C2A0_9CYAN|nr:hypothetical protein [Roseofilum casamattae]MDJ1185578.1 hypothetical protein [Roseofilum casamattae BLCC-M143]